MRDVASRNPSARWPRSGRRSRSAEAEFLSSQAPLHYLVEDCHRTPIPMKVALCIKHACEVLQEFEGIQEQARVHEVIRQIERDEPRSAAQPGRPVWVCASQTALTSTIDASRHPACRASVGH